MSDRHFDLDEIETTYSPFICGIVNEMMGVGASLDDVIKVIRISHDTLNAWRKNYPEFDKTIEEGLVESELWNTYEDKWLNSSSE